MRIHAQVGRGQSWRPGTRRQLRGRAQRDHRSSRRKSKGDPPRGGVPHAHCQVMTHSSGSRGWRDTSEETRRFAVQTRDRLVVAAGSISGHKVAVVGTGAPSFVGSGIPTPLLLELLLPSMVVRMHDCGFLVHALVLSRDRHLSTSAPQPHSGSAEPERTCWRPTVTRQTHCGSGPESE